MDVNSIVTLDLEIYSSYLSIDTISACDSLVWNGSVYYASGLYADSLISIDGVIVY